MLFNELDKLFKHIKKIYKQKYIDTKLNILNSIKFINETLTPYLIKKK